MLNAHQIAILVSLATKADPKFMAMLTKPNGRYTFDPASLIHVRWTPKAGYLLGVSDIRDSSAYFDEMECHLFSGRGQTIEEAFAAALLDADRFIGPFDDSEEITSEGVDVDVPPLVTEAQKHYIFDEPRCFGEVSRRRWKRSHHRETRRETRQALRAA